MSENMLKLPDERLDDLQNNGLRILQKAGTVCFSMDSVLLAHFARLRPGDRVADLGTGSGILPILMSQAEPSATFEAFERQEELADRARRSVALNGLSHRIAVHATDLRLALQLVGREQMDAVVCNPPYGKRGAELASQSENRSLSWHETDCTLANIAEACATLLRAGGRLWMCCPVARMLELADALRACRLEPKRLRMVHAKPNEAPYLLLWEAVKGAGATLRWLPPLIVQDENGRETEMLKAIYAGASANVLRGDR